MRRLIPACLLFAAVAAWAATPLEQDPYGNNKSLMDVLRGDAAFRELPMPRHTLCRVDTDAGEGLAIYEHKPLGRGVIGTEVTNFTQYEDDKLVGEPYMQSGAFGGMILLRGTSAPSRDFSYRGDPMFPLADGKNFKITLQRQNSKLEYACTERPAPSSMKLDGLPGQLHLVSCQRRTLHNNGETTLERSNHALCSNSAGLCPLHWTGDDGYKALFESYTVKDEKFSPVSWRCEIMR